MSNRNFFNELERRLQSPTAAKAAAPKLPRRNVYKAAVVSAVFVRVFGRDGS